MRAIPLNRPTLVDSCFDYLGQALSGEHLAGDGPFTKKCAELLERVLGVPKVLLTTSCTHALEMAALLLNIQPGDEVIVPAFTFVSTANAFVLRGATPVFADIRADTLNLDEARLESLLSPRTRAIVPVHYAGVACELEPLCRLAARHGVPVVEDNAHGLFGQYRGRYLGTFGCLATQSFHETKSFSCGEGGALLINDPQYIERALVFREKGTDRSHFRAGAIDKYTWIDLGSSYLLADVLAALLAAQLEGRAALLARRRRLWHAYARELTEWAAEEGVRLPAVPPHCTPAFALFYLVFPSGEVRQSFIDHLRTRGIASAFHYLPLHLSPMGRKFGGHEGLCPVAERMSSRLVRLPFYSQMTDADQQAVVRAVRSFRSRLTPRLQSA